MAHTTVVDQVDAAQAALSPLRTMLLRNLAEPASASQLARTLDLPRQRLNYHMRVLQRHGLIELVDEIQRRGFVERRFQRTGDVVLAPDLLATRSADSARDEASADAAIAAASDIIRDVGAIVSDGRRAATATMSTDITFASPVEMRGFLESVAELAARFDQGAGKGQRHRVTLVSYPRRDS